MTYKYYKTKYARLSPSDVFVLLEDLRGDFDLVDVYCPIGQHSQASRDYVKNDCKEISKETYLKVSKGIYTPEEYIK